MVSTEGPRTNYKVLILESHHLIYTCFWIPWLTQTMVSTEGPRTNHKLLVLLCSNASRVLHRVWMGTWMLETTHVQVPI